MFSYEINLYVLHLLQFTVAPGHSLAKVKGHVRHLARACSGNTDKHNGTY